MTVEAYPALEHLLPHRAPMILIDRLLEASEQGATCEVTITARSLFLEAAGVPAFVGIEYMAQSIAAYGGYHSYQAGEPIGVGLLLGTRHLTSSCPFFALDQRLHIQVTHVWGKHELLRFQSTITCASTGTLLQQAELNVFKPQTVSSYLEEVGHATPRTHQRR